MLGKNKYIEIFHCSDYVSSVIQINAPEFNLNALLRPLIDLQAALNTMGHLLSTETTARINLVRVFLTDQLFI